MRPEEGRSQNMPSSNEVLHEEKRRKRRDGDRRNWTATKSKK